MLFNGPELALAETVELAGPGRPAADLGPAPARTKRYTMRVRATMPARTLTFLVSRRPKEALALG